MVSSNAAGTGAKTNPAGFLGKGWAFPPAFASGGREVAMVSGVADVHQSLQILLATQSGERVMQETFGADLNTLMFEELDRGLINKARSLITEAIYKHEPRVELLDVDIARHTTEAYVLHLKLSYAIRGTNSRYNMVYPFGEATQARKP